MSRVRKYGDNDNAAHSRSSQAEEIRLLLMKVRKGEKGGILTLDSSLPSPFPSSQVMTALTVKVPSSEVFDECMGSIKRALGDNFPEVKRECCLLIAKMAKDEAGGKVLRIHGEGLIKVRIVMGEGG